MAFVLVLACWVRAYSRVNRAVWVVHLLPCHLCEAWGQDSGNKEIIHVHSSSRASPMGALSPEAGGHGSSVKQISSRLQEQG